MVSFVSGGYPAAISSDRVGPPRVLRAKSPKNTIPLRQQREWVVDLY